MWRALSHWFSVYRITLYLMLSNMWFLDTYLCERLVFTHNPMRVFVYLYSKTYDCKHAMCLEKCISAIHYTFQIECIVLPLGHSIIAHSLSAHLNYLSSLKGQLLWGIRVRGHQWGVVWKQGHEEAHVWVVQLLLFLPAQYFIRLGHPDAIWVEIHIQCDHTPEVTAWYALCARVCAWSVALTAVLVQTGG